MSILKDKGYKKLDFPLQVFVCEGEGCTENDANILHYNHIALAFLTGFLFATHLPERLAPGSFDYIGESNRVCGYKVHTIKQKSVHSVS